MVLQALPVRSAHFRSLHGTLNHSLDVTAQLLLSNRTKLLAINASIARRDARQTLRKSYTDGGRE